MLIPVDDEPLTHHKQNEKKSDVSEPGFGVWVKFFVYQSLQVAKESDADAVTECKRQKNDIVSPDYWDAVEAEVGQKADERHGVAHHTVQK